MKITPDQKLIIAIACIVGAILSACFAAGIVYGISGCFYALAISLGIFGIVMFTSAEQ